MTALLDVDQLRTFIAIAETGSFTKAADVVHKTQSAVSMQMKRLEERLDKPIFERDGRASKLTDDGERLLDYARRIVKLNVEALAAFGDAELSGRVRLGVPDDYADRYLPEIMARFSRAYPGVELTVICEPSVDLFELIDANDIDLAIVTTTRDQARRRDLPAGAAATGWPRSVIRPIAKSSCRSRSAGRPVAGGAPRSIGWRRSARPYRILYRARTPARYAAAVLAGLAVSVLPELGLRPGMRVLTPPTAFPNCHAAASASCAIRMKARRWPMRWPSTSSRRSITCRKQRRRRSNCDSLVSRLCSASLPRCAASGTRGRAIRFKYQTATRHCCRGAIAPGGIK